VQIIHIYILVSKVYSSKILHRFFSLNVGLVKQQTYIYSLPKYVSHGSMIVSPTP